MDRWLGLNCWCWGRSFFVGQVTLMVHCVAVEAAMIVLVGVVAVWTGMVA